MVLSALALVAFLALVILSFTRNENRATRTVAELTELRTLAGLPEKLVINQIRRATRSLGNAYSWTSQPGVIRVFDAQSMDADSGLSERQELFKLYSSPQMIQSMEAGQNPLGDEALVLQQWLPTGTQVLRSPLVADLNEPVMVSPRRKSGSRATQGQAVPHFPILHPGALGLVDGFEAALADPTRAPLPVYWLYVLRDGSVVPGFGTPDSADGTIRVVGHTRDNPIVGRIAFWTDDDSCRLNVNTASEAAPWSAPVTNTPGDQARAEALPAYQEFYRNAGHPAFTSLSPVFRHFGKATSTSFSSGRDPEAEPRLREPADAREDAGTWRGYVQNMLSRLPRAPLQDTNAGSQAGTQKPSSAVELRQRPLITSTDELLFSPDRRRNDDLQQEDLERVRFFLTPHSAAPETNLFNQPKLSLWPLQDSSTQQHQLDQKLALASSLPASATGHLYAFQRRDGYGAAQPATLHPDMEMGPTSRDGGLARNQDLFTYLRRMAELPVPGFGTVTPLEKYGEASAEQLLISMLDYLRWGVNPASPQGSKLPDKLTPEYRYLAPSGGLSGSDGATSHSAVALRVPSSAGEPALPDVRGNTESSSFVKGYGRNPIITEAALILAATKALPALPPATGPQDQNGDELADRTVEFRVMLVLEHFNPAPGIPGPHAALRYRLDWPAIPLTTSSGSVTLRTVNNVPSDPAPGPGIYFPPPGDPRPPTQQRLYFNTNSTLPGSAFPWAGNAGPYGSLAAQFLYTDAGGSSLLKQLNEQMDQSKPMDDRMFCGVVSNPIQVTYTGTMSAQESQDVKLSLPAFTLRVTAYQGALGDVLDAGDPPLQSFHISFPATTVPMPLFPLTDEDVAYDKDTPTEHPVAARMKPTAYPYGSFPQEGQTWLPMVRPGDVVRAVELAGPTRGDARLAAGRLLIPTDEVTPALAWFQPPAASYYDPAVYQVHTLRDDAWMLGSQQPAERTATAARPGVRPTGSTGGALLPGIQPAGAVPAVPTSVNGAYNGDGRLGDFDNGPGRIQDGPYIGFPGLSSVANEGGTAPWLSRGGSALDEDGITYSPWLQISSGFAFGSLPTGIYGYVGNATPRPWQTLLLCPHPLSRSTTPDALPSWSSSGGGSSKPQDHFGFSFPRDHLWLEYFWMPTVEPNHMTGCYSTQGKVNLNQQLVPFVWIKRNTALHGALQGVRITALPTTATAYKDAGTGLNQTMHYAVNHKATVQGLTRRYDRRGPASDVYRSPSEICDVFLVPERLAGEDYGSNVPPPPTDYDSTLSWWQGDLSSPAQMDAFELTGDNTREQPYAQLYPRLCTRSNVFTVHYRVQLLSGTRANADHTFNEGKSQITAEQRGSATVERYLDPNDPALGTTDYLKTDGAALDDAHRYRVVNRHTFAP